MRYSRPLCILLLLLLVYGWSHQAVWENRAQIRAEMPAGYVIPSKFSRVLALGNKGLLSDYLFLKVSTFFGGKTFTSGSMAEADWQYVIDCLTVVSDLDPYFVDPYFLAEGLLAWEAGMPAAANKLLINGARYRDYDWRLPFFVGFNYFYFLGDYGVAADYIMTAAQLPGSPDYFPALAARLAYYGGKSMTALLFLQEMVAEADDPILRKRLAKRLLALERAVIIEDALAKYRQNEGGSPTEIMELVTTGYLDELPDDPYGGKWGVLKNGRVFSTSKFVDSEPLNKK